jgi:hypothetical protein
MEYITLSAQGFTSNIYANTMANENMRRSNQNLEDTRQWPGYGQAGYQMSANTLDNCAYSQYSQAMSQAATNNRKLQAAQQGFYSNQNRQMAGF